MARKALLVVAFFGLLGSGSRILGQEWIWRPYLEVEGRASCLREVGQGSLFLPLSQDSESLLFADLRGLWTDVQSAEGNWGLAYRTILPSEGSLARTASTTCGILGSATISSKLLSVRNC